MEKFKYYFKTIDRISAALDISINRSNMSSILFNLVWYAYYNVSHNENEIISYVSDWFIEHDNKLQLSLYAKSLKRYINQMEDMPWRNFDGTIKIRKSELEYISSFDDIKKEKLLFCYLAIAKFYDIFRKKPTHWENEDDAVIFKMARVTIPSSERDYYINDLINIEPYAKIYLNYTNDDTSKRIDYISDDEDDEIAIEIDETNYYELAYTYLNWKNGGGYKKCSACGRLFKVKTSKLMRDSNGRPSNAQYCEKCFPKNEPMYKGKCEPKQIVCVDCGKTVYIDNFADSRTCRCSECQHKKQLEYQRNTMKKIRNL